MYHSDEEIRQQWVLETSNNRCVKCGMEHCLSGYGDRWLPQEATPGGEWVIGNLEVVCVNCRRLPGDPSFNNPINQDFGFWINFLGGPFIDKRPGPSLPVLKKNKALPQGRRIDKNHTQHRSTPKQRPALLENQHNRPRLAVIDALQTAAGALGPITADHLRQANIHTCQQRRDGPPIAVSNLYHTADMHLILSVMLYNWDQAFNFRYRGRNPQEARNLVRAVLRIRNEWEGHNSLPDYSGAPRVMRTIAQLLRTFGADNAAHQVEQTVRNLTR